jgi:magnesium-transporting ATPase (P-type)
MKINFEGVFARILAKKVRDHEPLSNLNASADFWDFVGVASVAAVILFLILIVIHGIKHKGFSGFDPKDNALLAFWLTVSLILIGFVAFVVNVIINV